MIDLDRDNVEERGGDWGNGKGRWVERLNGGFDRCIYAGDGDRAGCEVGWELAGRKCTEITRGMARMIHGRYRCFRSNSTVDAAVAHLSS